MITNEEVRLAKILWEQADESMRHAHDSWSLLWQSKKALVDSYRNAGLPYSDAAEEFDGLMEAHSKNYKAALEHMDRMSQEYRRILESLKQMAP